MLMAKRNPPDPFKGAKVAIGPHWYRVDTSKSLSEKDDELGNIGPFGHVAGIGRRTGT